MKFIYYFSLLFISTCFITCSKDGVTGEAAATGTGGSVARFTIAGNHLYLADYWSLEVYDLSVAGNPVFKKSINIGFAVETIYPYQDKLFIGSTNGMFIYSITNPSDPVQIGQALHVRSCDPVVAAGNTAYVTLRSGAACGVVEDGLYIYDISNITKPVQKSLFKLSSPFGLGVKDSVVFVCRGSGGLSLVNVKNPSAPKAMYTVSDGNYIDVIPYDNILISYMATGLLIYDISNLNQIVKVGNVDY
jgi:hypothetical protein